MSGISYSALDAQATAKERFLEAIDTLAVGYEPPNPSTSMASATSIAPLDEAYGALGTLIHYAENSERYGVIAGAVSARAATIAAERLFAALAFQFRRLEAAGVDIQSRVELVDGIVVVWSGELGRFLDDNEELSTEEKDDICRQLARKGMARYDGGASGSFVLSLVKSTEVKP